MFSAGVIGGVTRALLVLSMLLCACSSDSTPPRNASSSSGGQDSGPSPGVGLCTTFVDRSADSADRRVPWDITVKTKEARCMTIKAGQKVTWSTPDLSGVADFATHPLEVTDGDTPSPIATYDKKTGEVTFPKAGTFGFGCGIHGSMDGAIQVK
jgi:plastocyanin